MNAELLQDLERVAQKFAPLIAAAVRKDGLASALSDFMAERADIADPLFEEARAVARKHNIDELQIGVAFVVMVSTLAEELTRPTNKHKGRLHS